MTSRTLTLLVTGFIIAIECAISFNSLFLPEVQESMTISDQLASYSISFGLFATGFAAMLYGSLCDGMGRRPIIVMSSILFSIGTAITIYAQDIILLAIGRLCQGLGSGAGWVVGNASLRDVYSERAYVRIINYVHSVVGIVPAIAPVIGSYLLAYMQWRNIFSLLLIFSLAILALQIFFLPETLKEKKKITPKIFFKNFSTVLLNRRYQYFSVIKILTVMLLFMDIGTCSLMLVNYMGVEETNYGYYVFPLFSLYVLGTIFSEKILSRFISIDAILILGVGSIIVGNLLTVLFGLGFGWKLGAIAVQGLKMFTYLGFGLIFGNATGSIVDSVPKNAGSGAAMMIAFEMILSSIGLGVIGVFFDGSPYPYSIAALVSCASVLMIIYLMNRLKYIPVSG